MKKLLLLLLALGLAYGAYRYFTPYVSFDIAPAEPARELTLPGVYTANRDDATDILELHPDGSYARNYRPPGGTTLIHQGQWERVGDHVNFTNFAVTPDDDAGASNAWRNSRRAWSARLVMSRTEVQIVINAERALLYSKRGE